MKQIINRLYRWLNRTSLPPLFSGVDFDMRTLKEGEKIEFRAAAKAIIDRGVFAKLVAARATTLKNHVALSAADYDEVVLCRVRLAELDSIITEIKNLAKEPRETEDNAIDKFKAF